MAVGHSQFNFQSSDQYGGLLHQWTYGEQPPTTDSERLNFRLNLWLFAPPSHGNEAEIVASHFSFAPVADTTGVFRPSNAALYLKTTNPSGFADAFLAYGLPGDYPVTGDWDGDGVDTIGVYRAGNFYLRNSNTTGFADLAFAFGVPGDQPVVGDWDGDGITSIRGLSQRHVFPVQQQHFGAS